MKVLLIIVCTILSLSLCSCSSNTLQESEEEKVVQEKEFKAQLKDPPDIFFLIDKWKYKTIRGTSSWTVDNKDGTCMNVEIDSAGPLELVELQEQKIVVSKLERIKIDFDVIPNSYNVYIWGLDMDKEKVILEDNTFIVQDNREHAIYEVHAFWNQGNAYYAIEVIIE